MGPHAVGELASELAVGIIPHTYRQARRHGPAAALRKAFVEANASIHARGQQNREFEGMGTTATALVLRPDGAWVGHVGDSRALPHPRRRIEQLSFDHSLVWEYARGKNIDPDEVQDIPSNVILRCLGPEPLVQVDIEGAASDPRRRHVPAVQRRSERPGDDAEIGAVASAPAAGGGVPVPDRPGQPARRAGQHHGHHRQSRQQAGDDAANGAAVARALPLAAAGPLLRRLFAGGAVALWLHQMFALAAVAWVLAAVTIIGGIAGLFVYNARETPPSRGSRTAAAEDPSQPVVPRGQGVTGEFPAHGRGTQIAGPRKGLASRLGHLRFAVRCGPGTLQSRGAGGSVPRFVPGDAGRATRSATERAAELRCFIRAGIPARSSIIPHHYIDLPMGRSRRPFAAITAARSVRNRPAKSRRFAATGRCGKCN